MRWHFALVVAIVCSLTSAYAREPEPVREWLNVATQEKVDGQLFKYRTKTAIWLKTSNGETVSLDYADLGTGDREYLVPFEKGEKGRRATANSATQPSRPAKAAASTPAYDMHAHVTTAKSQRRITSVPRSRSTDDDDHCRKYILCGCRSTIHLVGDDGTIAYWLEGVHYLAGLERVSVGKVFSYWKPECSDPDTLQWAIAIHATPCHGHAVWRFDEDSHHWEFYDYVCVERPR